MEKTKGIQMKVGVRGRIGIEPFQLPEKGEGERVAGSLSVRGYWGLKPKPNWGERRPGGKAGPEWGNGPRAGKPWRRQFGTAWVEGGCGKSCEV